MTRYIALLRGINISGKNKIAMPDLKNCFEDHGFYDVRTYLNSGNVLFSSDTEDDCHCSNKLKKIINHTFGFEIPVFVMKRDALMEILLHAPEWWGNDHKDMYDNMIFLMPSLSYETFYDEIGDPKKEYEKVFHHGQVVFWSYIRKDYQKTNWWSQTAKANFKNKITIRTANTIRKLLEIDDSYKNK